ncbi:ATP-binding protein [Halorutilales archaeon Cl-col2-1]
MSSQKGVSPVFDTIYDCLGYERMAVFDVVEVEDNRLELSVVRGYRDADSPPESLAVDSVERCDVTVGDDNTNVAVPLEIDREVRKVLVIEVAESERLDETDVELLTTFGSCLSGMVRIAGDYSFLIDMLTHDLRNYLSVIKGTQTIRLEEDVGEESESVRRAYESAVRSEELLEEVRNLAHLSQGTETEKTDLNRLVRESVESFGHDVDVETRLPDETVYVRANDMLVSVLDNLLKNSVEHSRLESDELRVGVTVETCECDDEALLTVEDNGEGIPDEVKRHLFERGVKDDETGSTGIGLYLVRRVVESYGGEVEAGNSDLYGGAKFSIRLPLYD